MPGRAFRYCVAEIKNGCLYFINNRSDQPFEGWVELLQAAADMAVYDPMTGQSGLGLTRNFKLKKGPRDLCNYLPWGSWVVQPHKEPQTMPGFHYQPSGNSQPLSGMEALVFVRRSCASTRTAFDKPRMLDGTGGEMR